MKRFLIWPAVLAAAVVVAAAVTAVVSSTVQLHVEKDFVGNDIPEVRRHSVGWRCCNIGVKVVAVAPVVDWPAVSE